MFLSLLTKKEKLKFLDLAVYMIDIDGKPTEVEKKLISRIYGEIGREIVEEYTFSKSDSMEDDLYNTLEHLFLERIEKELGITAEKRKDLMQIVYDERDVREKAMRVIKY